MLGQQYDLAHVLGNVRHRAVHCRNGGERFTAHVNGCQEIGRAEQRKRIEQRRPSGFPDPHDRAAVRLVCHEEFSITIALRLKLPMIRKWVAYMTILSFATGTQLFVEPQLVNQASLGLVPDTWSSNQLAFQMAFRYGDFNGAAAVSIDLIIIGLVAAVLIVKRTGLFKGDD